MQKLWGGTSLNGSAIPVYSLNAVTLFHVFFIRIPFRKQEIRHVRTMWVRVIFRCLQTCFQQACVLQKFKFKYLVILNGTLSGKYFFVKKSCVRSENLLKKFPISSSLVLVF